MPIDTDTNKPDLVPVTQFCLTCGDENYFDMDKHEIYELYGQYVELNYCEYPITLPPEDCYWCEMYFYEEEGFWT